MPRGSGTAQSASGAAAAAITGLLPGVYSQGPSTTFDRCRAVGLWRADAVLSHRTAAWLWGLLPEPGRLLGRTLAELGCPLEPNDPVLGYYGDLVDAEAQLVVEIDGRAFRRGRGVFTQDRRRRARRRRK